MADLTLGEAARALGVSVAGLLINVAIEVALAYVRAKETKAA